DPTMAKAGISGLAVALAAGGGVLAYAGFRGVSLVGALREISSKQGPAGLTGTGLDLSGDVVHGTLTYAGKGSAGNGALNAAQPYMKDLYSQARRRDTGY